MDKQHLVVDQIKSFREISEHKGNDFPPFQHQKSYGDTFVDVNQTVSC